MKNLRISRGRGCADRQGWTPDLCCVPPSKGWVKTNLVLTREILKRCEKNVQVIRGIWTGYTCIWLIPFARLLKKRRIRVRTLLFLTRLWKYACKRIKLLPNILELSLVGKIDIENPKRYLKSFQPNFFYAYH